MTQILPQTRNAPGGLRGPAPVAHQVREVSLRVEALGGGRLRVSTPAARGWAKVVSTRDQLTQAVSEAFVEAQIASHSAWRGERYDLDDLTEPLTNDPMAPVRPKARRPINTGRTGWGRNQQRPDMQSPEDWTKLPDGRWQSPGGKHWGPETLMVQRVVARRVKFNLPV
jgi:hypothetical protein